MLDTARNLTRDHAAVNIERMISVNPLPALKDNYIWLLQDEHGRAAVVDPGEPEPVFNALASNALELAAILVTHHHWDHTGGIQALLERTKVPVYGPAGERTPVAGLTRALQDGDRIEVLGETYEIIEIPGHTLGHIAYYGSGRLFSGDTLFSAGCGRVFEGQPAQMLDSLSRLASLPGSTQLYCGHEYTESNLSFASAVEPDNGDISAYLERVRSARGRGEPSLPSTLDLELRVNPFLRCREASVAKAAASHTGRELPTPAEVFAAVRGWKDHFRTSTA